MGVISKGSGVSLDLIDGVSLTAVSLLIGSSEFDNAAWTKRGTALTAVNNEVAPDGTMTADELTLTGFGVDDIFNPTSGHGVSTPYQPSIYIKKITSSGILKMDNPPSASLGEWEIDLSVLGAGWERVTEDHAAVTVVNTTVSNASGEGGIFLFSKTGVPLNFHVWGALVEEPPVTISYV